MLDPFAYRMAEEVNMLRSTSHVVDHFERIGFPVRINSLQEVASLLNSMQENRFDLYMSEMGGLTEVERGYIVGCCIYLSRFQQIVFPKRPVILPLSVLMSVMCIYRKMRGINPEFETVLEIGPGCGYLSLLIASDVSCKSYCQIEACESFYILQNMINVLLFSTNFADHAFDAVHQNLWCPEGQTEAPPIIEPPKVTPLCEHFPWWKIGDLVTRTFDIVTSNANLLEFQPAALEQYLRLIVDVLAPDGALLAQCLGSHVHGTPDELFAKADEAGLALVTNFRANDIHNALWVRKDHTPFDVFALINRVFYPRPEGRTVFSMQQIVDSVKASL